MLETERPIKNRKITLRINQERSCIVFEKNNELQYSRYVISGEFSDPVEIYMSDELRTAGLPFKKLKELGIAEIDRIRVDPFGETSIDPHVSEDFARAQRAINRLKSELQDLIGYPVAIKSSVPESGEKTNNGNDLVGQYLFMRRLQLASEKTLTNEQKSVIEFLPIYGVVRVGNEGFLIMKLVKGKEVEDQLVIVPSGGWGYGYPELEPAFSIAENRVLIDAFNLDYYGDRLMRWTDLTRVLSRILGIPLHDLAGRNVLCCRNGAKKKYTIIDQVKEKIN